MDKWRLRGESVIRVYKTKMAGGQLIWPCNGHVIAVQITM